LAGFVLVKSSYCSDGYVKTLQQDLPGRHLRSSINLFAG